MFKFRTLGTLLVLVALLVGVLPFTVSAQAPGPDDKTLVIAQQTGITSLDPPNNSSRPNSNVIDHLFGFLFHIDDDANIVPYLAKEWRVNEERTEVTFTLNEGLTCHDGEPLTAEDVVYTFERAVDPDNAFTGNTPGFVLTSAGYAGARVDSELEATILVERDGQKGIVIGKGGAMLKAIGTEARVDIEELLGRKAFLRLTVKVRKDWRETPSLLNRLFDPVKI